MQYQILDINDNIKVCLVYIDEVDESLKQLIESNFLEIIIGKKNAEREEFSGNIDSFHEASKYILKKSTDSAKVGIIGEFLFHCFMRLESISSDFLSCCPTIGYSDTYQGFFKGFDGCYHSNDGIWISEMKSKIKSNKLNEDNKGKLFVASRQINNEVNDTRINRWEKTKYFVLNQLTEQEIEERNVYKLLTKENSNNYNKILGTMLVCKDAEFDIEYIKTYVERLKDTNVPSQKLFLMCIRNFDYKKLREYIQSKYGDGNE